MSILCLDFGERYIGVALSDRQGRLAVRHSTIDQKQQEALPYVKEIVTSEKVEKILVGVPVSLEGKETQQTHISLAFIETLRQQLGDGTSVEGVDETLTSVEAARLTSFEGKPEEEHAEAARLMLEDYLRSQ